VVLTCVNDFVSRRVVVIVPSIALAGGPTLVRASFRAPCGPPALPS